MTEQGQPDVDSVSARTNGGTDFAKAREIRRKLGLDGASVEIGPEFNDPAFSRQVLRLDD